MTREEIIEQLENAIELIKQDGKDWLDDRDIPMLEECIKALSQESCDDAISREAVLNIVSLHTLTIDESVEAVKHLPSVTQKSGKWNEYYTSQKGNDVFNCKECGHTFVVTQGKDNMNYCPNCGAKMESEDEK